jgi:hypothetical protein
MRPFSIKISAARVAPRFTICALRTKMDFTI